MRYVCVLLLLNLAGCRSYDSPTWDTKILYTKDGCAWLAKHVRADAFFLYRFHEDDKEGCKQP